MSADPVLSRELKSLQEELAASPRERLSPSPSSSAAIAVLLAQARRQALALALAAG
jgi:hypothetical protein